LPLSVVEKIHIIRELTDDSWYQVKNHPWKSSSFPFGLFLSASSCNHLGGQNIIMNLTGTYQNSNFSLINLSSDWYECRLQIYNKSLLANCALQRWFLVHCNSHCDKSLIGFAAAKAVMLPNPEMGKWQNWGSCWGMPRWWNLNCVTYLTNFHPIVGP
jgi:hypothetical protein